MQLPRGTFREIKKNETVRIILEGLENERFSGVCTLSFPAGDGVLVYRKGKYVLAKVRNLYGDAGIAELRGILDKTGDAALSQLDETQIKLALEFNKQAIVQRSGSVVKEPTTPSPPHNPSHGDTKQPAEKGVQTGTETVIIRPTIPKIRVPPTNNTTHPAPPARVRAPLTQDPQKDEQKDVDREETVTPPDRTGFDLDMEEIDSMDLERVTDKIRGDCKTMIKQLDLEYLLER